MTCIFTTQAQIDKITTTGPETPYEHFLLKVLQHQNARDIAEQQKLTARLKEDVERIMRGEPSRIPDTDDSNSLTPDVMLRAHFNRQRLAAHYH